MADPPGYPDSGPDTQDGSGAGRDHGAPPGMPRWVKVSAIVVGVLILLVVGVMLIGGHEGGPGPGGHGPGRHGSGTDDGANTSPIDRASGLVVAAGWAHS